MFHLVCQELVVNHGELILFYFFAQAFLDIPSADSRDSGRGSICELNIFMFFFGGGYVDLCLRVNRKTTQRK